MRLKQPSGQLVFPGVQLFWHTPFWQTCPGSHSTPHSPQCIPSDRKSTQVLLHFTRSAAHTTGFAARVGVAVVRTVVGRVLKGISVVGTGVGSSVIIFTHEPPVVFPAKDSEFAWMGGAAGTEDPASNG